MQYNGLEWFLFLLIHIFVCTYFPIIWTYLTFSLRFQENESEIEYFHLVILHESLRKNVISPFQPSIMKICLYKILKIHSIKSPKSQNLEILQLPSFHCQKEAEGRSFEIFCIFSESSPLCEKIKTNRASEEKRQKKTGVDLDKSNKKYEILEERKLFFFVSHLLLFFFTHEDQKKQKFITRAHGYRFDSRSRPKSKYFFSKEWKKFLKEMPCSYIGTFFSLFFIFLPFSPCLKYF